MDFPAYDVLLGNAQILIGAAIFWVAAKTTWTQIGPFVMPALKWARNKLLSDLKAEQSAALAAVAADLAAHRIEPINEAHPPTIEGS